MAPERIRAAAYGRERPIAECGEPRCGAQNRRAVTVVRAPRRGRNAADDEIVRLVGGHDRAVVVTSDAELARRVRELGADVMGAGTFRGRLGSTR